jgi:hypothetical protein
MRGERSGCAFARPRETHNQVLYVDGIEPGT